MATRFWIGVAVAQHVEIGRARGICAFGHGKHSAVARLGVGDRFIYYATKTRWEDGASTGDPVQAFVASGTVLSSVPRSGDWDGAPAWVKDACYDAPIDVPVRPLLERFSFVHNPQHWGMAFRRSLFEIPQSDFETIQEAANGSE